LLSLMTARNLLGLECRAVHLYANRRGVGVPESNLLNRVAPAEPAELVPFQAGANICRRRAVLVAAAAVFTNGRSARFTDSVSGKTSASSYSINTRLVRAVA
jgi:hypothetical protein